MAKITITKGKPYDLSVIVKQPGSLNPADLTDTATATFYFVEKANNQRLLEKQMTRIGMPEDAKFLLELTEIETAIFPSRYSLDEDGTIATDTCRGHIHIEDTANAIPDLRHADILIGSIYIADLGA